MVSLALQSEQFLYSCIFAGHLDCSYSIPLWYIVAGCINAKLDFGFRVLHIGHCLLFVTIITTYGKVLVSCFYMFDTWCRILIFCTLGSVCPKRIGTFLCVYILCIVDSTYILVLSCSLNFISVVLLHSSLFFYVVSAVFGPRCMSVTVLWVTCVPCIGVLRCNLGSDLVYYRIH